MIRCHFRNAFVCDFKNTKTDYDNLLSKELYTKKATQSSSRRLQDRDNRWGGGGGGTRECDDTFTLIMVAHITHHINYSVKCENIKAHCLCQVDVLGFGEVEFVFVILCVYHVYLLGSKQRTQISLE